MTSRTLFLLLPIAAAFELSAQAAPPKSRSEPPAKPLKKEPPGWKADIKPPKLPKLAPDAWSMFHELPPGHFDKLNQQWLELDHTFKLGEDHTLDFEMKTMEFESKMFDLEYKKFDMDREMAKLTPPGWDLPMIHDLPDKWAFAEHESLMKEFAKADFKHEKAFFPPGATSPKLSTSRIATQPPAPWATSDPADSLYKVAREMMNRGEYRRAAQLFREVGQRYPGSAYAPDCFYWQAFSLYRIGTTQELKDALTALEQQKAKYPQAGTQADAQVLAARIQGALAQRGDSHAAKRVGELAVAGQACDKEDQAVRAEALNALAQSDPEALTPLLRKVLERKDECSAPLRRRAIFLLGRRADSTSAELVAFAARNETDPDVRVEAIGWLARMPGDRSIAVLEEILRTANEERIQRAAVRALNNHSNDRARRGVRALIERNDVPERLRMEAIGSFDRERSTADDAAYLRSLYPKLDNQRLKEHVIQSVARLGGTENEQWLLGIARNAEEPTELRAAALRRAASGSAPIADVVRMYDGISERRLREQLIQVYAYRKEPEATDKLLDIARTGTDPGLRTMAINALTRKNDPRTTKLLLEIIGK